MGVEHLEISVDGGDQPLVVVAPNGDQTLPYLLIVPSIFGVADDLIDQMTELSADAVVVAVDPFWRVQPGALPYTDFAAAVARMNKLDRELCYADWCATIAWARQQARCSGRVISLGICFGGPFCLLAAADGLVDGVLTWHGSQMQNFVDRADEMTCPMIHHVGGADRFVPPEAVAQLRAAFVRRPNVAIVVHDGADHGFSHSGPAFDQRAERAGIASAQDLLRVGTMVA